MKKSLLLRALTLTLLVVLAALPLSACTSQTAQPPSASESEESGESSAATAPEAAEPASIKIAVFTNLTGAHAPDGEYAKRALDTTLELFNDRLGGVQSMDGAKFEFVYYDLMSDNTMIKTIVEKGLSDPDIAFGIGTLGSSHTMAAIPAISKAGVPFFTSAMSDIVDEQNCEYLWLIAPLASEVTQMTLDFIVDLSKQKNLDTTKIGITYCDNEFGVSTTATFKEQIEADPNLDYVYLQSYPPTVSDMSPIVTSLRAAGTEILYIVPTLQDAKLFAQAVQTMDYNPLIVGGAAGMVTPTFGDEMGDNVLGILSTAAGSFCQGNAMANPDWKWVTDTYNERYGGFNGESINTYISYLQIIKDVLEKTATLDRETNQAAMYEMEFEAPQASKGNIIKFNENRRNQNALNIMCQWQYVEEYNANIPVCVYPEEAAYNDLQHDE